MRDLFRSTPGGKAGTIDGLNLFFGALLGANLGTIQGMRLSDYLEIIILLAGSVVIIRMLSTSERRVYLLVNVVIYVVLIGGILLIPKFQPKGVSIHDLHRLAATLGVWLAAVITSEMLPVRADSQ
jgi:predicted membrane channel-forming protein YqfA (hemolysin III family)